MTGIGTLGEGPLHAALKEWIAQPGDAFEVELDGFVIDVVRGPQLIEIQTRSFSSLRRKLDRLLDRHPIRLVHPVAIARWIQRVDAKGNSLSRRRSPKKGMPSDLCEELVSFPTLLSHPNLTLEVMLVHEDEIRRPDRRRRRRGYLVEERRLVDVVDSLVFECPADLLSLLPDALPEPFTTAELAAALGRDRTHAQAVAYCLREAGVIESIERTREGHRYRRPRTSRAKRRTKASDRGSEPPTPRPHSAAV